jgi:hypothetical protein
MQTAAAQHQVVVVVELEELVVTDRAVLLATVAPAYSIV